MEQVALVALIVIPWELLKAWAMDQKMVLVVPELVQERVESSTS